MSAKRLTQLLPFLLPVRVMQRKACFYAGMRLDGNRYAEIIESSRFEHKVFEADCPLYNRSTGFDMVYQENKVFNLKLAAKTLDGVLIRPGETFSFWQLVRRADKTTPYKDGLIVKDGKLTTAYGGGMCQMSNLLFWLFLHTPLTIVERRGHEVKEFPEPNEIKGVDATLSEGWIDLKVRNDTAGTYQLSITFDDQNIIGAVLADSPPRTLYRVVNGETVYFRDNNQIHESVEVQRVETDPETGAETGRCPLYTNTCKICYQLPDGTPVLERAPI